MKPVDDQVPDVSLIISGWKDAPHLMGCLKSIAAAKTEVTFETIIGLNEPSPRVLHQLHEFDPEVECVVSKSNSGYGGINNLAAELAQGDFIGFLNDDTQVTDYWLDRLVDVLRQKKNVGAVGSLLRSKDWSVQNAGTVLWSNGAVAEITDDVLGGSQPSSQIVPFACGASLLTRRSAFESVGGFDDDYFPAYYEDVDFAFKLRSLGLLSYVEVTSEVIHLHSASSTPYFAAFLSKRNQQTFVSKWHTSLRLFGQQPTEVTSEAVLNHLRSNQEAVSTKEMDQFLLRDGGGEAKLPDGSAREDQIRSQYITELEAQLGDARLDAFNLRLELQQVRAELDLQRRRSVAIESHGKSQCHKVNALGRKRVTLLKFLRDWVGRKN